MEPEPKEKMPTAEEMEAVLKEVEELNETAPDGAKAIEEGSAVDETSPQETEVLEGAETLTETLGNPYLAETFNGYQIVPTDMLLIMILGVLLVSLVMGRRIL